MNNSTKTKNRNDSLIGVRLKPSEIERLKSEIEESGLSTSAFLRKALNIVRTKKSARSKAVAQ